MLSQVTIPIFRVTLILSVSDSVKAARENYSHIFGKYLLSDTVNALASSESGCFAVFFHEDNIDHGLIAHEIFHITHRIIDWIGGRFELENQEQHAYLCEWITDWVYKELKENKIELK